MPETKRPARVAIFAKLVFTMGDDAPIDDGGIIVEGDRIVEVGRRTALENLVKDARRVDARECALLPGFINMHVHLDAHGDADFLTTARLLDEQTATLAAAASARDALAAGVTTVRDLGTKFGVAIAVRDAVAKGWLSGPHILAAGKPVCMTGGHGWFIALESDGPHEMRKAVRQNLKMGADCIKVIATGGVLSPGVEVGSVQLDEDEMSVAVREARKAGRRVAAHAIANSGIKNAVRCGIDTVEHGCFLDAEAVEMMKKAGTWYVPTLCAPDALYRRLDDVPAYVARKVKEVYEAHRESFRLALREGVRIVTGTDAGTPFNRHGDYARELVLMAELGMPIERALRAGTADAADALGLAHEIGAIAPGKRADVVLIDGDPRRDIRATQRVKGVMARGSAAFAQSDG